MNPFPLPEGRPRSLSIHDYMVAFAATLAIYDMNQMDKRVFAAIAYLMGRPDATYTEHNVTGEIAKRLRHKPWAGDIQSVKIIEFAIPPHSVIIDGVDNVEAMTIMSTVEICGEGNTPMLLDPTADDTIRRAVEDYAITAGLDLADMAHVNRRGEVSHEGGLLLGMDDNGRLIATSENKTEAAVTDAIVNFMSELDNMFKEGGEQNGGDT